MVLGGKTSSLDSEKAGYSQPHSYNGDGPPPELPSWFLGSNVVTDVKKNDQRSCAIGEVLDVWLQGHCSLGVVYTSPDSVTCAQQLSIEHVGMQKPPRRVTLAARLVISRKSTSVHLYCLSVLRKYAVPA